MTTPHSHVDAVLRLLGHRRGAPHGGSSPPGDVDPAAMVAFASAHFVLPALAAPARSAGIGLAPDLIAFLVEMESANRARNVALRDATVAIAAAFRHLGVTPLALKGGAFLLDPTTADATAWRFMSDIDLLVEEGRLDACVAAVRDLGFTPAGAPYDPRHEAHYPPLVSRCGTFSIELHTRLFGIHEIGPSLPSLAGGASTVAIGDARALIPSREHRIAHLIAHAQIHNRFYVMRRISLRDGLDLAALLGGSTTAPDWPCVLAPFAAGRERDAALAFLAYHCDPAPAVASPGMSDRHRAWASAAHARLYMPRRFRAAMHYVDTLRAEFVRLRTERGHLTRRLALAWPERLARARAIRRYKTAQKLW